MKRSLKDRRIKKVQAKYHTSKNYLHPEQCPAHFREPLEDISTGRIVWNLYRNGSKHYESPMIEKSNDEFWEERSNIVTMFSRKDLEGTDDRMAWRKRKAEYRALKRGKANSISDGIDEHFYDYFDELNDYFNGLNDEYFDELNFDDYDYCEDYCEDYCYDE